MPLYFDLEVHLDDCKPRMWRRFLLFSKATFEDLHYAIQDACGWTHGRLYEFLYLDYYDRVAVSTYLKPYRDADMPLAAETALQSYFKKRKSCKYLYRQHPHEMHYEWCHIVKLNGEISLPENFKRRLLDGQHLFPPEDFDGKDDYDICRDALSISDKDLASYDEAEREDLDHRELLRDWHPEDFDLEAVKKEFDE